MDKEESKLLECCRVGSIHKGTPVGALTEISGRQTYVTGPQDSPVALFIIHDVFGLVINNIKVLADKYSSLTGARVYVPDFYDGDAVDFKYQTNGWDYLENVVPGWMAKHPPREFQQFVDFAKEIRPKHKKMVVMGFCWGAPGAFHLASVEGGELADAVAVAHPSLTLASDWENLTKPNLTITCEFDAIFTEEKRKEAMEASQRNTKRESPVLSKWVYYPGCYHGFSLRGDEVQPLTAAAMADATQEVASFVRLHTQL